MTDQENIQTARENVAAFSAKDWTCFKATLSPQSVYDEQGTQRRVQGADQVVHLSQGWAQAFPDAQGTVTSAVASGDSVVVELIWEGTQTGPLQGPAGSMRRRASGASSRPCKCLCCRAARSRRRITTSTARP